MPLYEYQCTQCGTVTDIRHGFKEVNTAVCEACGGALKRVFNAAGIVFKGAGFYVTDSRKGGATGSDGTKKTDGDAKPDTAVKSDGVPKADGASKSDGGSKSDAGSKSNAGSKKDSTGKSSSAKGDAAA